MPAFGVTATMETGDYHNPLFLNLEEYTVGEAPHSRTPAFPVDDRELQWVFCHGSTVASTAQPTPPGRRGSGDEQFLRLRRGQRLLSFPAVGGIVRRDGRDSYQGPAFQPCSFEHPQRLSSRAKCDRTNVRKHESRDPGVDSFAHREQTRIPRGQGPSE